MPHFCHQISYTSSAWQRVMQNPQDRFEAVRAPVASLGGTVRAVFFALDSYDVLAITEFPESTSPADISVAFFATAEVAQMHTTQLLDAGQALEAMRKAGPCSYQAASRPRELAASAS
jgi:uncharacterized protein with GYD domain